MALLAEMKLPLLDLALVVTVVTTVVLGVVTWLALRRRRQAQDTQRLTTSEAEKQNTPPSLHPVIDPAICIGSLSCVRACPEGDILGLVEGKATLVEGAHCIGHSKCAIECPVDAITLVFGTKEKGVDLPETDERFESSREGVFIVGELGGMGLIKNALRQGLEVAKALKARGPRGGSQDAVDVAIVGSGPAGIATAVGCKEAGLSFRVLEQDTLGGTVSHYPRNKVVMTEAVALPFYGRFGRALISKEELLVEFQKVLASAGTTIEEGTRVEGLTGSAGDFTLKTTRGDVKARAIVLATGLRGTPRKLGAPGEERPKVTYRLVDPTQFDGQRVLVVGGGDSAVEAAIQLATETKARVTISYRQDSFSRAKPRNRELIAELTAQKRVRAVMGSQVKQIDERYVLLETSDGQEGRLKNDHVIVCVGGELPTKFLEKMGVSIRRYHEEAKGEARRGSRDNRVLAASLTLLGLAILLGLAYVGRGYYLLDDEAREAHALHELLRPSGLWGHGVGVVATLFMMSNFVYALRKRWRRMKGAASIRTWLTFHVFVGLMSPAVIAFHAAFQSRNLLATGTYAALAVVVGTGVFGRFLFALVPAAEGRLVALEELQASFRGFKEKVEPLVQTVTNAFAVQAVLDDALAPPPKLSLLGMLLYLPRRRYGVRKASERARRYFLNEREYRTFTNGLVELLRLRVQLAAYERVKRLFRVWLALHIVLSLFMVALIAVHVAWSLYWGYAWVFSADS